MSLARAVTLSAALLAAAQAAAAQDQPTRFTIKVENISRGEALKLSNGKAAPFVSAPVLWAVHGGSANPLFVGGQPDAGKGLETLAETGNPGPLLKSVTGAGDIASAGADDLPVGATAHGPIRSSTDPLARHLCRRCGIARFFSTLAAPSIWSSLGRPLSTAPSPRLAAWRAFASIRR